MIVEWLVTALDAVLGPIIGLLPSHTINLPDLTPFMQWLADIDSVLPIASAVTTGLVILSALGVFLLVRLALLVWANLPFT